MATKKQTVVKIPKSNTVYGVLTLDTNNTVPFAESYGSIQVFKRLDDAVEYVEEGLEDTTTAEEIALVKTEYRIVAITELSYDVIPKQAAKIKLHT